jgi:hypothetical protein
VLELSQPFIRLPSAFDADLLSEEIGKIADSAWMSHPQRMHGNSAVALISKGGEDNDAFTGAMAETPHLQACPYVRQVLASFGVVLGRSRLMKLAAGAEVALHVDFNYHWYSRVRIHIPIITNPDVTFYCADQQVHMQAGESWLFNAWRRHRVTNNGGQDRVHLVVDTAGSSQFWNKVREMAAYDPLSEAEKIEQMIKPVAYQSDKEVEILTEKYNIAPVMAPGEVDALVDGVIRDFEQNSDNDQELMRQYKIMLLDFAKDWREIWLLNGYQPEGWPQYRQAIDRVAGQLQSSPQALLTQSNRIRINQVIVHRILSAALAVETMDQFVGSLGTKP